VATGAQSGEPSKARQELCDQAGLGTRGPICSDLFSRPSLRKKLAVVPRFRRGTRFWVAQRFSAALTAMFSSAALAAGVTCLPDWRSMRLRPGSKLALNSVATSRSHSLRQPDRLLPLRLRHLSPDHLGILLERRILGIFAKCERKVPVRCGQVARHAMSSSVERSHGDHCLAIENVSRRTNQFQSALTVLRSASPVNVLLAYGHRVFRLHRRFRPRGRRRLAGCRGRVLCSRRFCRTRCRSRRRSICGRRRFRSRRQWRRRIFRMHVGHRSRRRWLRVRTLSRPPGFRRCAYGVIGRRACSRALILAATPRRLDSRPPSVAVVPVAKAPSQSKREQ